MAITHQDLKKVILNHVAKRPRAVVVTSPVLDANRFGGCDLNVIDIAPIPQGLEHRVGETEHEDVLHRLLAQIMVDTEDLIFVEDPVKGLVECAGGLQVAAKRLFDDNAAPCVATELSIEPGGAQLLDDFGVHFGRN